MKEARLLFGDLPVVHVGTVLPDGSPHVVPMWFLWREEAVYVSCRQGSTTWSNIERSPRTSLAFHIGRAWDELAGVVVYGRADPLAPNHPALRRLTSAWFEKYRDRLAGDSFRSFTAQVERPGMVRIKPERLAWWNHASSGLHRGAVG